MKNQRLPANEPETVSTLAQDDEGQTQSQMAQLDFPHDHSQLPTNTEFTEDHSVLSIPNTLREQLHRAQLLLNQSEHARAMNRDDIAFQKAQQAVSVISALIARTTEGGTLAVLADMGLQGYQFGTVEETESFVIRQKRAFGLSFGEEVVPTRTVVRRNSQGRVF